MIRVITNDLYDDVVELFYNAKKSIRIVSPFLSNKTAELLCEIVGANKDIECDFVTRLYIEDMIKGANSIASVRKMIDCGIKVYSVNGLHTKLYLFDEEEAIIGSANFTISGLKKNLELSIDTDEESVVSAAGMYVDSVIEQCLEQINGVVDSELCDKIEANYTASYQKYITGKISISTAMYGANIKPTEVLARGPLLIDGKDQVDEIQRVEFDVVHSIFAAEDEALGIDPNLKTLIKFGGVRSDENEFATLPDVLYKEKKIYILNASVRPRSVQNSMQFVFTRGYKDKNGKSVHIIAGRGQIEKFEENNIVLPKWIEKYDWMKKYKYYIVVKEFETLNAPLSEGLVLDDMIGEVGADFYTTTSGQELTLKQIHQHISRRPYLYITPIAKAKVDKEFDKLVARFGSTKYVSEL